jgi:hypothetical protein
VRIADVLILKFLPANLKTQQSHESKSLQAASNVGYGEMFRDELVIFAPGS